MKKLLQLDPSYYKLDLRTGNIIYFSHAKPIKSEDHITIDVKDVIYKIDELIEAYNSLSEVIPQLSKSIDDIKNVVSLISDRVDNIYSPIQEKIN